MRVWEQGWGEIGREGGSGRRGREEQGIGEELKGREER